MASHLSYLSCYSYLDLYYEAARRLGARYTVELGAPLEHHGPIGVLIRRTDMPASDATHVLYIEPFDVQAATLDDAIARATALMRDRIAARWPEGGPYAGDDAH